MSKAPLFLTNQINARCLFFSLSPSGLLGTLLVIIALVNSVGAQLNPGNRPDYANLVYDPASGEVVLSGADNNGGRIISFALGTNSGTTKMDFLRANLPFEDTGQNTDLTAFQIGQALDFAAGDPTDGFDAHGLGKILPTNMDLEVLVAYLDVAIYASSLGFGGNFDALLFDDLPEGDFTGDSLVELEDANVFCTAMSRQEVAPAFNLVGDSSLKDEDLSRMLDVGKRRRGDADWDGSVGFSDFLRLSGNFGQKGTLGNGDTNCDGEVSFGDFLTLSGNFGETTIATTAAATVPEPASHILLVLAALGIRLGTAGRSTEIRSAKSVNRRIP